MQIITIKDKKQLNDFVGQEAMSQFLQSWQWGEFQKEVSGFIWRIGVEDGGQLLASAKLVKKQLPMGKSYFYCGRGPILKSHGLEANGSIARLAGVITKQLKNSPEKLSEKREEIINLLLNEVKRIAEGEDVMFLRFEPVWKSFSGHIFTEAEIIRHLTDWQLIKTIDVQPSQTLILDLTKSEGEILRSMRQKTRYNIRLAEKKGVKIVEAGANRFEEFWQLLVSTGDRDEFNLHGRNYYQAMLKIMDGSFVKLLFAEYQGKPLAGNLVIFFGDTATYIHGGSSNENREDMAPYALQWQIIKQAKQAGCKYYDFHGIDEIKWPGVTRFKMGFGGEIIKYPGTFDLVFDPSWYSIYKMVRKIRRTF
ncbi:peptidoglycan bridge formation glycyltransferase FemA/FemB family protein [Candidatus Falkowbacteria bacterium]|nr:peptidoglycan bridge formation glycyltransferase FemA/FemB family protein [Candidatus Falkowbacteria bacterium]